MNFINPEGNAVRILSLDGGDARCLSQLLILQELMHRLEHDHGRLVRPCEYFHSITGVGASGVIAILLGVLGMAVENAMKAFAGICEKVFPPDGCSNASRSERLTLAMQGILVELGIPYGTRMEGDIDLAAGCCVSICYSTAAIHGCRMFRNYKSRQFSYNPTIIEAVQVSWATPGWFSSVLLGTTVNQEEFISAVNEFNNPALEAARDARDTFGKDKVISTFLSLGSGASGPISISSNGFLEKSVLQTESVEETIERLLGTSGVYFRFSPQHTIQGNHSLNGKQLAAITSYTRAYIERERISRSMDDFLKASAYTSHIDLELKDTALLINTKAHPEPHASIVQGSTSHPSHKDDILLSELRIPGLQCGSPLDGCMEGTRRNILKRINYWTTDFSAPNILWLKGYPGVGKSAIATEVVEELGTLRCLGSSFFFQRQNATAMTPQVLWRMVAYDLAARYPTVHSIVVGKLREMGVGAATSNVEKLFRHLIYEPLMGSEEIPNAKLPVVVIDALDECGGLEGQYSQHRRALMKTLEHWTRLPGKFKLIVTSRGENDLERFFSRTKHHPIEILAGQTVDQQSSEDIGKLLTKELQEIAAQYPRSLSKDWPGSRAITELSERAAGLFIWAETVVKFIALGDAPRRLNQVLQGGGTGDMGFLYEQILSTAFREPSEADAKDFRSVVGTIILAKTPLSFSTLSQLLSMEESTVEHICNELQSVLDSKGILQFHHQSFVDFLLDQKKCPPNYLIQPKDEHPKLTVACFRTMGDNLRFNICRLESSHLRNIDIPDVPSREKEYILSHLSYSCSWWASHLAESKFDAEILEHVQYFMRNQFLWWLEVLSVANRVNVASRMLSSLIDWIPSHNQTEAFQMARDMQKFVSAFASVISQSLPHIYVSALPFSPQQSPVSKQYAQKYAKTLVVQAGGLSDWPAIQNVLYGHKGCIRSVSFSPDGKRIVSGSDDKTIRVWDAETGEVVAGPFEGHTGWVNSVAFSPDGRRIVSGSYDESIRVWDAETGDMVIGPIEGHDGVIKSVAFSPDGKRFVSGGNDMEIRVWDAATGDIVAGPFKGHTHWVNSVVFSLDGQCIISGSEDKTIRVWDAETFEVVAGPFEGHRNGISSTRLSPDGKLIVSGSDDKTIRVWNVETGELVAGPFEGHDGAINSVAFAPDGKRIVSGSDDKTIRVWDVEAGGMSLGPFTGHSNWVNSVAFSPDGKRIVSGSYDNTVRVWDADTGDTRTDDAVTEIFEGHSDGINAVVFSPDGKRIFSGSYDKTIRVWDAKTGEMIGGPFKGHSNGINSITLSNDGKLVVSGSLDKTMRVWDAETAVVVSGPFEGHRSGISSVTLSPDGKYIASGSYDRSIRVWDAETGKVVAGPFQGHSNWVNSVAFSPDGTRIVSGSYDKTVRIWDVEKGGMALGPFEGHGNWVNSVAFSPDGKRVVSGSYDKTIRVWDAETGEVIAGPLEGHDDYIRSVTFSPDGRRVISGAGDKTILVWDIEAGKVVAGPFQGHSNWVNSVSVSPDGKRIASGSYDKTIRVWDTPPHDAKTRCQTSPAFVDSSTIVDGWVLGSNSELLFWVPPALHAGLWRPSNTLVIGDLITTRLDLKSFVHGDAWTLCRTQQNSLKHKGMLEAGTSSAVISSPYSREGFVSTSRQTRAGHSSRNARPRGI